MTNQKKRPLWRRLIRGIAYVPAGLPPMLLFGWLLGGIGVAIGIFAMFGAFLMGFNGESLFGESKPAVVDASATAQTATTVTPPPRRRGLWWKVPAGLVGGFFMLVLVAAMMAPEKPKDATTAAAGPPAAETPPKPVEQRSVPPTRAESKAIDTASLDALAVACRTSAQLDSVVDAFGRADGPDRLNALVRSKDCSWLKVGTRYSLTDTKATDLLREIKLEDDRSTVWVLKKSLLPRDAQDTAGVTKVPTIDDRTFVSMATMEAALDYAKRNCLGSADPNAEGAVAMVARRDPAKMQAAIAFARAAVQAQAEKLGIAQQCRNIVEAYGPSGALNKGAWRPRRTQ